MGSRGSRAAGECGASADIIVLDKSTYKGLGKDGSPVLMQMEINKSKQIKEKDKKAAGSAKKRCLNPTEDRFTSPLSYVQDLSNKLDLATVLGSAHGVVILQGSNPCKICSQLKSAVQVLQEEMTL